MGLLISLNIMEVVEGEEWKGALETSSAEQMQNVTIPTKALPASVPLSVRCGRKHQHRRETGKKEGGENMKD